jgi:predicted nucleotidyltransferase
MLMAIPAERMAERAAAWAESDAAARAVIVYGSLAQGTADDDSDLDVIIVAEPGQREGHPIEIAGRLRASRCRAVSEISTAYYAGFRADLIVAGA